LLKAVDSYKKDDGVLTVFSRHLPLWNCLYYLLADYAVQVKL